MQEIQETWAGKIPWRRAWRIPRTEEPRGLQSIESQRVRHAWSDLAHTHAYSKFHFFWDTNLYVLITMWGSAATPRLGDSVPPHPQSSGCPFIVWTPPLSLIQSNHGPLVGQMTLTFLPGKFHGQRSLADFCPWGLKGVGHNLAAKQQYSVKWECTVYYTTIWKHITISISNRPLKDFYIFVFEKLWAKPKL